MFQKKRWKSGLVGQESVAGRPGSEQDLLLAIAIDIEQCDSGRFHVDDAAGRDFTASLHDGSKQFRWLQLETGIRW